MHKFLVTGVSGFIGSSIARKLLSFGYEVIGVDVNRNVIEHDNFTFFRRDLCGSVSYLPNDIDYIIHQASLISVPGSVEIPATYLHNNYQSTLNLLEYARVNKVKKFMFASSSSVYGNTTSLPTKENDRLDPQSPYALSKMICEQLCKCYNETYKLNVTCLRYFNVYGPGQDLSGYANAIPIFLDKMSRDEDVTIYGDGQQTRDFVYIDDIVNLNIGSCLALFSAPPVLNVGSCKSISVNELFETMKKLMGSKSKVVYAPKRAGDVTHTLSNDIALGHKTKFSTGIDKTIKVFLKN